ncbi:TCP-1/cpn60 chaperonin family protein [Bradyrhizobium sp.]|uniref:TCP-1/cpn60 chaperonin family protein n=1 Tax=Bradyrhizobium sp. TaxID=376 RepID=UPI003C231401
MDETNGARMDDLLHAARRTARGIRLVGEVAQRKLGPGQVLISAGAPSPSTYAAKHDFLFAESTMPADRLEAFGAEITKAAAIKTDEICGDGATLTAILAQSITEQSARAIESGADPVELQRGIDLAVKTVLRDIRQQAYKTATIAMYQNVARISADGDPDVASVVARTFGNSRNLKLDLGTIRIDGLISNKPIIKIARAGGGYRIKVAGGTEAEARGRKRYIEMSLRAVRAAQAGGVVAGGGAALLHASRALQSLEPDSQSLKAGVDVVLHAVLTPIRLLVENAQVNSRSVIDSLLRESNAHVGYDITSGNYADMIDAGIVDTAESLETALTNAAEVATTATTAPAAFARTRELTALQSQNPHFLNMMSKVLEPHDADGGAVDMAERNLAAVVEGGGKADAKLGKLLIDAIEPSVRRYLVGDCPDRVVRGGSFKVAVYIALSELHEHTRALDLNVPEQGLGLDVVVKADGFEIRPESRLPIHLPPRDESTRAEFSLRALDTGDRLVRISVFNGGTALGGLDIAVNVAAAGEAVNARRQASRDPVTRFAADETQATLKVEYDKKRKEYSFDWRDSEGDQPADHLDDALSPVDGAINDVIGKIQELVRRDYPIDPSVAARLQREWGISLWNTLVPEKTRKRFIDRHRQSMLEKLEIISDGDPFPWEMLYPFEANEPAFDKGFLVDIVELSRWRLGSRPPKVIALRRADFVIPNQGPANAENEADEVSTLLRKWSTALKDYRITKSKELYDLLDKSAASLLHFACHNAVEAGTGRIIIDSPVTSDDFGSYQGKLKRPAPFVFMNACRSDDKPLRYTRIGGWANCFLAMGAGAFMGTLWEVRDETARKFAEALYEELLEGNKPFSIALRLARKKIRENAPEDPTWLAYSFYGAGGAHLEKS